MSDKRYIELPGDYLLYAMDGNLNWEVRKKTINKKGSQVIIPLGHYFQAGSILQMIQFIADQLVRDELAYSETITPLQDFADMYIKEIKEVKDCILQNFPKGA